MLIFLVSLCVFFAALVIAYAITLHGRPVTAPIRVPSQLWMSTVLLAASSGTLAIARWAIRRAKFDAYRGCVIATGFLAAGFAVSQFAALGQLLSQGVYVEGNPSGSVYFAFTCFHGAHMLGGLIALGYLLASGFDLADGEEQPIRKNRNRLGIVQMYWTFLTISWLVLFALLLMWSK